MLFLHLYMQKIVWKSITPVAIPHSEWIRSAKRAVNERTELHKNWLLDDGDVEHTVSRPSVFKTDEERSRQACKPSLTLLQYLSRNQSLKTAGPAWVAR